MGCAAGHRAASVGSSCGAGDGPETDPIQWGPARPTAITMNLIYVGDAMCSWCYGFARTLEELLNDPGEAAPLQLALVMGGLRPFTTEPMSAARADELAGHWQQVAQASGQPFTAADRTVM